MQQFSKQQSKLLILYVSSQVYLPKRMSVN